MKSVLRVGLVSSVIPKKCGIANFSRDLREGMLQARPGLEVLAIAAETPDESYHYELPVIGQVKTNRPETYSGAAEALNNAGLDVVLLQHEFGLYGGAWAHLVKSGVAHEYPTGDYILALLERLQVPAITTFHTVLSRPDPQRRQVIRRIAQLSAAVVTMSRTTKQLLIERYGIPRSRITIIPHGVPIVTQHSRLAARRSLGLPLRNTYLTVTGLLGPNKGVDLIIKALPAIIARHPSTRLLVVGQTHPGILATDGEAYRDGLVHLTESLGMREYVFFVNAFLPTLELMHYLRASDIYLTIHRDRDQAASGTLAYAVGTGLPSISTPYTYAQELLAGGRGVLVPFENSVRIVRAVNRLLAHPALRRDMVRKLRAYRRSMSWHVVAGSYLKLIDRVAASHANILL